MYSKEKVASPFNLKKWEIVSFDFINHVGKLMIFGCNLIVFIVRAQPNLHYMVVVEYAGMVIELGWQLRNLIYKLDSLREVRKFEFFVQFIFFYFPHRFLDWRNLRNCL